MSSGDDGAVVLSLINRIYKSKRKAYPQNFILMNSCMGKTKDGRKVICFDDEYKLVQFVSTEMRTHKISDHMLGIRCVKWNPNISHSGWVAYGNNSGFVFCHPVAHPLPK